MVRPVLALAVQRSKRLLDSQSDYVWSGSQGALAGIDLALPLIAGLPKTLLTRVKSPLVW